MYTIGKLSRKTGITVRTLDYYDEIGLMKASSKTSGGHRLYSEDDVIRLERILALKYLGFSLEKIKVILEDSATTYQQSIQQQLTMIRKEQTRLKALEQALLGVSYSIEYEGEMNWQVIFDIIHLYQEDADTALKQYESYLNEEQMNAIVKMNENMSEKDIQEWMKLISEIKQNLEIDPRSQTAQQLVNRWMEQVLLMFGEDEQLLHNMWESLKDLKEGITFYPMDKKVISFIEKALIVKEQKESE